MLKIGLVGNGRWAKILKKKLSKFTQIVFVSNTKKTYKNKKKIDYCFIVTTDSSHFKIAKYFLKKKIPVFCEKPLSRNFQQCKAIIKISKKYNTPIFIDHIEYFKKKVIKIRNKNLIIRSRNCQKDLKEILWNLCYHDLYLLYNHLKNQKLKIRLVYKSKFQIKFEIKSGKKIFIFFYDNNSVNKKHYINNINFITKKDYLIKMMKDLMIKKNININENNKQALFCVKTILLIQKIIFKS